MTHAELVVLGRGLLQRSDGGCVILLEQSLSQQQLAARGLQRTLQALPRRAGRSQAAKRLGRRPDEAGGFKRGCLADRIVHTLGELDSVVGSLACPLGTAGDAVQQGLRRAGLDRLHDQAGALTHVERPQELGLRALDVALIAQRV